MNLELKKFDMSSIKPDKVIVLIGKRETGKSFLCKDLLYYHKNIPVFTIPVIDAIGTKKQIGTFAANALPLPGALIRPDYFSDPSIDNQLKKLGIKTIITPTSQFQLSGGSVHCVTNEL